MKQNKSLFSVNVDQWEGCSQFWNFFQQIVHISGRFHNHVHSLVCLYVHKCRTVTFTQV